MVQSSLYAHFLKQDIPTIIITEDAKEAQEAYHLSLFAKESGISTYTPILLPDFRARYGDDLRSFYDEFICMNSALREFYHFLNDDLSFKDKTNHPILIAPISSLLYALPSPRLLQKMSIQRGKNLKFLDLKQKLLNYGYEMVEIVEMPGEVSFRGDILDIGIPGLDGGIFYRLSFFDDECESIRIFDVTTQKSNKEEIDSIEIPPAIFALDEKEAEELNTRIEESDFDSFSRDIFSLGFWFLDENGVEFLKLFSSLMTPKAKEYLGELLTIELNSPYNKSFLDSLPILAPVDGYEDIMLKQENLDYFLELNASKKLIILVPTDLMAQDFNARGIKAHLSSLVVNIATPQGYIISLNSYPKQKRKNRPKIAIDELNIGEYVVHRDYGIGIFSGIKQAKVLGCVRDFIEISYQGEDVLLLPVENLNLIDRYIAGSSGVPMVDRLGKGNFAKLREKIKAKLFEIADSIIALAAKRNLTPGKIVDTKLPEISIFQRSSGFELTEDQKKSIDEIFLDISSGRVMDRLLSGDVGFGKTEVALNAIFAVCKNGMQAVLVVPTTLLAFQHFQTLKSRLSSFKVARLDRFSKAKSEVLKGLKDGSIDVVVGTHSILGAEFKNLGLIIIDEEHKFGVKQKEAIKSLSKDVHLLSMSATPIPRTLNMALSHIKGMSTLTTPPFERVGSKTFVKEKSDALIKEAILRELRRNGQIFYVHNNISHISTIKSDLLELLPDLSIAILHSQIDSKESEEIMLGFAEHKYQLLLCTSIVESGIHLPNANSIIVDGADRFGLADLHQLRGRVGRGDKEGWCYFLVDSKEGLTPEATKRLLALEKNSFLGSGAMIAYQDLEIRGGGNLLGEAQSGHIKNIGYSLYLKMLEDAIYTLSSKEKIKESDIELRLQVSAYLSPELISSDTLRLELYRRLSLCQKADEIYEIEREIKDRFGELDLMTNSFLMLMLVKILAKDLGIKSISNFKLDVAFEIGDKKEFIKAESQESILEDILGYLRSLKAKKA